jgi:hypothetical protein
MKRSLLSLLFLVFITVMFAQERVYVPALKSPENNALNQMPDVTVSWYAITGSLNLQYRFQVDTSMLFNSPSLIDTTQTLLTGYKTRNLLFGQKYYWRVRAIDGQTSAWSVVWSFTVFNTVELDKPLVNAVDQDPNVPVSWLGTITNLKKVITGITYYEYQVDSDTNFNSPNLIHGTTSPTVLKANTINLFFGMKYYFRVRAGHTKGYSSYCPYRAFTIIDKFGLISPTTNTANAFLNVVLKWKAVNGLLGYAYQIATDQAFTHLVAESEVDTNNITSSYLQFGIQYYWRVNGRHLKDTSQWSNPFSFTTINTVDLKAPANNQQSVAVKPIMQWIKQTGITNYELWIDTDPLFSNPYIKYKPNANETQYTLTKALSYEQIYYWKMRVYSDGDLMADTSNWSPVWSFVTVSLIGLEEKGIGSYSIYPNPASSKIYLKMDSRETTTVQFELIDLLGKRILEKEINLTAGNNLKEISLENINKGIYMVRLNCNGSSVNQKLIIEK